MIPHRPELSCGTHKATKKSYQMFPLLSLRVSHVRRMHSQQLLRVGLSTDKPGPVHQPICTKHLFHIPYGARPWENISTHHTVPLSTHCVRGVVPGPGSLSPAVSSEHGHHRRSARLPSTHSVQSSNALGPSNSQHGPGRPHPMSLLIFLREFSPEGT